jgi:7-cyano-7-deazaguanine synthase
MKKHAVLSLSGGLDSSTLLLHLLANGYNVTALSFDYGQKHKIELQCATDLVNYININSEVTVQELEGFDITEKKFPPVKHQIIKLDGLAQLLNSTLVEGGAEVPEGHYASENMKETVVPNRNKIFSSIIQAVALSIATKNNSECIIAMGIHAGDHAIYPDCRQQFRDRDDQAFVEGNWDAHLVKTYTPYLEVDKFDILKDGESCCECLNLDFNEVYKRTNTSYKPILVPIPDPQGWLKHSWYSDYKSASSVERIEAFIKLGKKDPVNYAEILKNGEILPRTWDEVKIHVKAILLTHNNK